jgi:hypothetical protein
VITFQGLELPRRMAKLPRDHRGYPVPWFVYFDEQGVPDFRVLGQGKVAQAVNHQLCWVCGEQRGRNFSFVIGPMCAVNRISAEPPCHRDCAIFSARACPFLSRPKMRRNEKDLPQFAGKEASYASHSPGIPIERNPGVTLVWGTRSFKTISVPARPGVNPGVLFNIGEPEECLWYAQGRTATRAEVLESIDTGLPILREACNLESSPESIAAAKVELEAKLAQAITLLPAA